jgi:hypothetical protein
MPGPWQKVHMWLAAPRHAAEVLLDKTTAAIGLVSVGCGYDRGVHRLTHNPDPSWTSPHAHALTKPEVLAGRRARTRSDISGSHSARRAQTRAHSGTTSQAAARATPLGGPSRPRCG